MSEIKVNKISPRTACGTTTLGDSGDTISIPAGVTITNSGTANGFGADGAVNWDTTIQTSTPFTAVSGNGYFINTAGGAITMNLPTSPSVGDIVAIKDYGGTFQTYNLTIGRGGSNMNGAAADSIRDTKNESLTMVYADATKGWLSVEEGTGYLGENFLSATGGTITEDGNYKIHTFTAPGTLCVSALATNPTNNAADYIVVGGGGGGAGGSDRGGAGGAGGFRGSAGTSTGSYTAGPSPIVGPVSAVTLSATSYPIVVGGGGAGKGGGPSNGPGTPGCTSSGLGISSAGGGAGGGVNAGGPNGASGGGGGTSGTATIFYGGTGNQPVVSPAQGNDGGPNGTTPIATGGGGGIASVGGTGAVPGSGSGGDDLNSSITGSPVYYAGGGGGGGQNGSSPAGPGSPGGSGTAGGATGSSPPHDAANAPDNRGGGGGGASNRSGGHSAAGGNGGSGIVIIRYKFQ